MSNVIMTNLTMIVIITVHTGLIWYMPILKYAVYDGVYTQLSLHFSFLGICVSYFFLFTHLFVVSYFVFLQYA